MPHEKSILEASEITPMSKAGKEKIAKLAEKLEGKEWFPRKVALAKKTLANVKTLPI